MSIIFDTLQYTKRAKEAGFTESEAEFQANELAAIIHNEISTKQDINEVKEKISENEKSLKLFVKHAIKTSEISLIKWFIGLLAGQTAIILTVLSLIGKK